MSFWTVLDGMRPNAARPAVKGFQRYLYIYLDICITYLHTFVVFAFCAYVYLSKSAKSSKCKWFSNEVIEQ